MIWSNNTKVFGFRYVHEYYDLTPTSFLTISPKENTLSLMNRYGILINSLTNGFDLYINTTQTVEEYLNYLTNTTQIQSFEFNLITNDPLFYSFTNLPVDWQGVIEYSSAESVYHDSAKLFAMSEHLSEPHEAAITATLEVSFDHIIKALKDNQEPVYQIEFATRYTQWQYFIVNMSNPDIGTLSIDSGEEALFGAGQEVTLPNNQKAIKFSSGEHLLPLKKEPKAHYKLVAAKFLNGQEDSPVNSTVFPGLPNPRPDNFLIENNDQETLVVSPIYVYI